jgi:dTDP-4-dehydrorhamnose 3,5-epimerase
LGGEKDPVSITADWTTVSDRHIDGVCIREVRNVPTGYGHLTELFRADWDLGSSTVGQVFQSVLLPGRVSAWHAHGETTDRLFVSDGQMLVVLYDARPDSPTHSTLMTVRTSILRPQLIVVPPRIWHGIKNTGNEPATLINAVDIAYRHDGPDHYRLPETTDQIPFDISTAT